MNSNHIINYIKQNKINVIILVVYSLIIIAYHCLIQSTSFGDDATHKQYDVITLIIQTFESWNTWSSRILVNLMGFVVALPDFIWKICNCVALISIPILISKIAPKTNYIVAISCAICLLFPFFMMCSAGWIATTTVYIWPTVGFLISIYYLKKSTEVKLKIYEYIILFVSLIYATNLEYYAIIILLLFTYIVLKQYIKEKTINKLFIIVLIIAIISTLIFLLCPGNHNRLDAEGKWIPEFARFTGIDKLIFGLGQTARVVFDSFVTKIFFAFTLTIIFLSIINRKKLSTILSLTAIAMLIFFEVNISAQQMINDILVGNNHDAYCLIGALVIFSLLIATSLYFLLDREKFWMIIILLVAGSAVYVATNMVPTALVVWGRPMVPLLIIMFISMVILLSIPELNKNLINNSNTIIATIYWLIIVTIIVSTFTQTVECLSTTIPWVDWGNFSR